MLAKFDIGQKVTTTYLTGNQVFIVRGINHEFDPIEYWLQGSDGSRETFPEHALREYVAPFDPQPGQRYTDTYGSVATVLARVQDSEGHEIVLYELPSWVAGNQVKVSHDYLASFEATYTNLMESLDY